MDDDELAYFQAATREYREFAEDADIDYRLDGALVLSSPGGEDQLRAKAEALQARGVECSWLEGADLRDAEPELSVDVRGAALLADTAQVSPMRVVGRARLTRQAARRRRVHRNGADGDRGCRRSGGRRRRRPVAGSRRSGS